MSHFREKWGSEPVRQFWYIKKEETICRSSIPRKRPRRSGPYSQAMLAGGLLFTSGQIAINPESGTVEAETIEGQAEQVMKNLGALLEAAGSGV